jgi:ribose transport system substrate-binding protein
MAKYLDGVKSTIPPDRRIILPTRTIDRTNVEAFWTELKAVLCCMPTAREISR